MTPVHIPLNGTRDALESLREALDAGAIDTVLELLNREDPRSAVRQTLLAYAGHHLDGWRGPIWTAVRIARDLGVRAVLVTENTVEVVATDRPLQGVILHGDDLERARWELRGVQYLGICSEGAALARVPGSWLAAATDPQVVAVFRVRRDAPLRCLAAPEDEP